MSDELKPCPFCGSEAEVVVGEICFIEYFAVYCKECRAKLGVSGRLCEVYEWTPRFDTREAAIEAWNTRAERTCSIEDVTSGYTETNWGRCSSCGDKFPYQGDVVACPCCGARVVQL